MKKEKNRKTEFDKDQKYQYLILMPISHSCDVLKLSKTGLNLAIVTLCELSIRYKNLLWNPSVNLLRILGLRIRWVPCPLSTSLYYISLSSGLGEMIDKYPKNNNKDHLVGQLTIC